MDYDKIKKINDYENITKCRIKDLKKIKAKYCTDLEKYTLSLKNGKLITIALTAILAIFSNGIAMIIFLILGGILYGYFTRFEQQFHIIEYISNTEYKLEVDSLYNIIKNCELAKDYFRGKELTPQQKYEVENLFSFLAFNKNFIDLPKTTIVSQNIEDENNDIILPKKEMKRILKK